jgi:hypothetical protein
LSTIRVVLSHFYSWFPHPQSFCVVIIFGTSLHV